MENKDEYDPQLIDAVRKQIEYYFSKENLQNDPYLTSQMDAQMSVPITVVMKFAKLKALTQDEGVVRRALVDSSVSVVDNRIKANIKSTGRSTIILREIPSDAPEEEVKEIFNYEGCKNIISIRSDIGDTWFVTMETEEDAKDTALDLRLKKRNFRGQSVKARIKTEPVVRSFFPVSSAVPPVAPVYPPLHLPFPPVVPTPMMDLANFGYLPVPPAVDPTATPVVETAEEVPVTSEPTAVLETAEAPVEEADKTSTEEVNSEVANKPSSSATSTSRSREVRKPVKPVRDTVDTRRKGTEPRRSGTGTPNHSKEVKEKKAETVVSKPPIEVNAMTFPPLHTLEDTPVPTPGYKDTYIKYSFDAIIAIVKNVKEAILPADLNPADHPIALTATPNMDLLKRQRTFSIDETREQLRQGRPVQREAIISGAVDYRSLIFGDDQDPANKAAKSKPVAPENVAATTSSHDPSAEADLVKAVEEKLNVTSNEENAKKQPEDPTPASPQRISASTWAAMVKSSALATEGQSLTRSISSSKTNPPPATATTDSRIKKPAKEATSTDKPDTKQTAPPTSTRAHKADKDKKFNNNNNRNERRKQKDGNDSKTSDNTDGKEEQTTTSNSNPTSTDGNQSAVADSSNSSGAWGRTTFANVLKQTLSEEATEESSSPVKKAAHSTPSTSSSASHHNDQHQKPLKLNSRGNGLKDSTSSSRDNQAHRGERRQQRDRDNRDNQSHHSNSSHSRRFPEDRDRKEKAEEVEEK